MLVLLKAISESVLQQENNNNNTTVTTTATTTTTATLTTTTTTTTTTNKPPTLRVTKYQYFESLHTVVTKMAMLPFQARTKYRLVLDLTLHMFQTKEC